MKRLALALVALMVFMVAVPNVVALARADTPVVDLMATMPQDAYGNEYEDIVRLDWRYERAPMEEPGAGFRIYRNGIEIATVCGDTCWQARGSASDGTLQYLYAYVVSVEPGKHYELGVQPFDSIADGPISRVNVVAGLPSALPDFQYFQGTDFIKITWDAATAPTTAGVNGYRVGIKDENGWTFTKTHEGTRQYTWSGLGGPSAPAIYTVSVRAENRHGQGPESSAWVPVDGANAAPDQKVLGVTLAACCGVGGVRIEWAAVAGESAYKILKTPHYGYTPQYYDVAAATHLDFEPHDAVDYEICFRVAAQRGDLTGPWSDKACYRPSEAGGSNDGSAASSGGTIDSLWDNTVDAFGFTYRSALLFPGLAGVTYGGYSVGIQKTQGKARKAALSVAAMGAALVVLSIVREANL